MLGFQKSFTYLFLFCCAIVYGISIFFFTGTGDAGDSVLHFLYAKYAPVQPNLYLDQWAKPFFTLIASPFAQLGFNGIKAFNCLLNLGSIYLVIQSAKQFSLKNSVVAGITLFAMPLVYSLSFSGLTEPLFAFASILSIYFIQKQQNWRAALIISFLPFIRSEGLLIIGVIALYFCLIKEFKYILGLLVGHIIYSIVGVFALGDLFWLFTSNPYAKLSSTYGEGTLTHFAEKIIYVVGLPIYILFILGLLTQIIRIIRNRSNRSFNYLIILTFLIFFIAHTLFWYFGVFNSMGLIRVFICVAPLMALIALSGFNALIELIPNSRKKLKLTFKALLIAFIFIFPFLKNPAAINWNKDLSLSLDQILVEELFKENVYLKNNAECMLYAHPYISLVADNNHFNPKIRKELNIKNLENMSNVSYVIWDNWFSVVEQGITKEVVLSHSNLKQIATLRKELNGRIAEIILFEVN